jgi:hypothetical protein
MTELAFLRAFLAWETFLEGSFILYLTGQQAPRGRAVRRYSFPPNRKVATDWLLPEGRNYSDWTVAATVSSRAERHFTSGHPFAAVLRENRNILDEARIIRNAIAHDSSAAQEKFENMARSKLGALPADLTVGRFLATTMPSTAPPISFLEYYVGKIEFAAQRIVPCS